MIARMTNQAKVLRLPVSERPEAREGQALAGKLAQNLEQIRADAREQARRYQADTVVPEGGE